jgi:hypothetical protein
VVEDITKMCIPTDDAVTGKISTETLPVFIHMPLIKSNTSGNYVWTRDRLILKLVQQEVMADNGRNIVREKKELNDLVAQLNNDEESNRQINCNTSDKMALFSAIKSSSRKSILILDKSS